MATKKIKCGCNHEGQDKLYGTGVRLANKTSKAKGVNAYYYRCTVCLREA